MYFKIRTLLGGVMLAGAAGIVGCEVYESDEPPPRRVVYDDDYYYRGRYEGPEYIWVDRDGHRFHERREEHERRLRVEPRGRGEAHERHEEHEEHEHR